MAVEPAAQAWGSCGPVSPEVYAVLADLAPVLRADRGALLAAPSLPAQCAAREAEDAGARDARERLVEERDCPGAFLTRYQ